MSPRQSSSSGAGSESPGWIGGGSVAKKIIQYYNKSLKYSTERNTKTKTVWRKMKKTWESHIKIEVRRSQTEILHPF
jgi:hypothetical protein